MNPQPTAQHINAKTSSGQRVIFTSNQLQTVASGQNLQNLHSLPSGQTNASGQNLQPLTSGQNQTNLAQQQVLVNPAISNTSIITSLPYHHSPRPVKTILPNTLAPATNIGNNFQVVLPNHLISQPSSQVYVPAMTASGTTILLRLEEAQHHLQNGKVTFLPSGQAAVQTQVETSVEPILGHQQKIILAPGTTENNAKTGAHDIEENEAEEEDEADDATASSNIMRDKVALNLPVVMTKRTNKKLAQDNPFFRIGMNNSGDLEGVCRMCDSSFLFKNSMAMESHYNKEHDQQIHIHSFPLYYEINYKLNKNGSRARLKFFLCFYCGKEFTTKFNVRRHQMLYCPHKDKIDPRELGLGKLQDDLDDDPVPVLAEVPRDQDPLGLHQ